MITKRPPRHEGASSFAVPAWPLRRKVALALAIPLLLAATLGGLRVSSDLEDANNSSTSARQVSVLDPAVAYLVAAERAMVAAHTQSQGDLDSAVSDLKAAAQDLTAKRDTADLDPSQRYQVDVILDLSRALRESSGETLSPGTWVAQLRQLQSGVTQLITTIVSAQLDPEPRLELLAQTLGGRFSLAMQQALGATERTGETGSLELFAELGAEGVAIDRLATALGDTEPAIAALRTANAERFRTVRTKGTDLGGPEAYNEYDSLVDELMADIDQELVASADDARQRALLNAGITLGALVAAILLALLISRLILTPIRRVREGALSVAHEQLPEAVARLRAGEDPGRIIPIDVATHEEVGQLARAVDDLHRQAVVLASGEAQLRSQVSEMFVTLSRRNTALVNQQLSLIETLEQDEEDPRRLESLFRLDHLAARMRRTADSLLILADAPSRFGGQGGLTVGEAMQAATSGVQDYRRVRVGATSDLRIGAAAAGDVVHLLTELVDNALAYSAPTTDVTLSTTNAPGGTWIEIADGGLGIPVDALDELNEILRSGGDVTADTARRMGLFVVSRLAKRHGLVVSLRRNERGGTTASVLLPRAILERREPGADPATAEAATDRSVPVVAPDEPTEQSEFDELQTRINSALSRPATPLPQRPVRTAAQSTPPHDPAPPVPVDQVPVEHTPVVPERGAAPLAVVPALPARRPTEREADQPQAVEMAHEVVVPERHRLQSPEVVPSASASGSAALDGAWTDPGDDTDGDTPIFRAMRSAWLSSGASSQPWASSEVEAGWDRADRVAAAAPPVNESGLPQRRPGTSLVPGGVTKPTAVIARNPEAIRERLAAHAAGVSRGRAVATTEHEHTEAGPA